MYNSNTESYLSQYCTPTLAILSVSSCFQDEYQYYARINNPLFSVLVQYFTISDWPWLGSTYDSGGEKIESHILTINTEYLHSTDFSSLPRKKSVATLSETFWLSVDELNISSF